MGKTGLFVPGIINNEFSNININMEKVGNNTGNLLFWYALNRILDLDYVTTVDLKYGNIDDYQYSSFVTTDLIWITENATYPNVRKQLELAKDRPLIPISIGTQSSSMNSSFKLAKDTVNLLSELQERCILGVRGSYTAEILNKEGIKNIQVIGCPSLYFPFDYKFKISKIADKNPLKVNCNMRTLYSKLSKEEQKYLVYCANHGFDFCEQTLHPLTREICRDLPTFDYLNKWFNVAKHIFFNVDSWRKYMSEMDFSIGCRFHGNVTMLWEGKPSLFITIDSRTEELCQFFHIPRIKLNDFDFNKNIEYYYELANYDEFNKNYSLLLDRFISFLKMNNIRIKLRHDEYFDRRININSQHVNKIKLWTEK